MEISSTKHRVPDLKRSFALKAPSFQFGDCLVHRLPSQQRTVYDVSQALLVANRRRKKASREAILASHPLRDDALSIAEPNTVDVG